MLRDALKYLGKFDKNIAKFEATPAASDMPSNVKDEIATKLAQYRTDFLALVEGYKRKGLGPKEGILGQMREEIIATAENNISSGNVSTVVGGLTLVVLLTGVLMWLSRFIPKSMERFAQTMYQIADTGDLTLRSDDSGKCQIGLMARAFNNMIDQLQGLLGQVMTSSAQVGEASSRLAEPTEGTTSSVSRQRVESDQVATAMNQM